MAQQLPPIWNFRLQACLQDLLHIHGQEQHAVTRVFLLACIGTVAMPLYYLIWHHFFPQEYESLTLRALGIVLCLLGLFARSYHPRMLQVYLLLTLSYVLPFFLVLHGLPSSNPQMRKR